MIRKTPEQAAGAQLGRDHLSPRRRKLLQQKILRWYRAAHRKLPWRRTSDPYAIWISEVMLQQTQTAKVLEYFEPFLERFPNVSALANASLDEVLKGWEGMGYYSRARNLHRAARHIVSELQSQFPKNYDALIEIPGIGPYTAAAVASIAFNLDHAAVDGNVERVLSRIFLITLQPKSFQFKKIYQEVADFFLFCGRAREWNQALMELGALICKPRQPECTLCPAQKHCRAHRETGDPALLPIRLAPVPRPHHHIVVGVVWKGRRVLIDQRLPEGLLGGLWEFPGGKIEWGESQMEALRRKLREELAIEVEVGERFLQVEHGYTHFSVTLHVYHCRHLRGRPQARRCQQWKWAFLHELAQFAFPNANRKIIEALLQKAGENEKKSSLGF